MKKKIALLLAAALLSFGLIVSCSDDAEPEEPTNPGTPAVKYTVTFDANGGELAAGTKIVLTVESGKTIGTANWPDDPVKTTVFDYGVIEDDFNGWFDGTEKYSATKPITKDVTLVASYTAFVKPERDTEYVTALGWFTWDNNNSTTQRGWRANGADNTETSLDWADIAEARYIVLHTKGGAGKDWATGFGGMQIVLQSDGNGWGWKQTNINSFYYPRGTGDKDDVYVVIDITTLDSYSDFVRGTVGKFLIAYYDGPTSATGLGLQEVYITNKDLSKSNSVLLGSNKNKISGFATKANILDLTPPTDTKTVTFKYGYGGLLNSTITVATGKSMSLKYLDGSRDGWDFLGWFDGSAVSLDLAAQDAPNFNLATTIASWGTKYEPTTVITKDITLSAGWKEQKWPADPTPAAIAGSTKKWTVVLKSRADLYTDADGDGVDDNDPTKFIYAGGNPQGQIELRDSEGAWENDVRKGLLDPVLAARTANKKAVLRIFIARPSDAANGKPGWGIAQVKDDGTWGGQNLGDADQPNYPADMPDPGSNTRVYIDWEIKSDKVTFSAANNLILNPVNGATLYQIELWIQN